LKDDWLNRYTACACRRPGPEKLHYANGLWLLSACIGPRPLKLWKNDIYPNLSIMNLAPSGENKSGALSFARNILPSGIYIYPTGLTPEALIEEELSRHPEGVYGRDEYSVILALANSPVYSRGLNQIIAQIQDGFPSSRLPGKNALLNQKIDISKLYITFFGATTLSLYLQNVDRALFETGHAPRWLLVLSEKSGWVPHRQPDYNQDDTMCEKEVQLDLVMLHHNRPAQYRYDDDALERMNGWMMEKKEYKYTIENPVEEAVIAKWFFTHPHKLSVAMEVSQSIKEIAEYKDREKNVSKRAVDEAIDYIEDCYSVFKMDVLPRLMGENDG
jgi:hypothetical protein